MDYYRILEIKEDADFSDIKKKYRKIKEDSLEKKLPLK